MDGNVIVYNNRFFVQTPAGQLYPVTLGGGGGGGGGISRRLLIQANWIKAGTFTSTDFKNSGNQPDIHTSILDVALIKAGSIVTGFARILNIPFTGGTLMAASINPLLSSGSLTSMVIGADNVFTGAPAIGNFVTAQFNPTIADYELQIQLGVDNAIGTGAIAELTAGSMEIFYQIQTLPI